MKRILYILGALLLVILVGIAAYSYSINEERPLATPGKEAEALAQKIYKAVNKEAWDSLELIRWSFRGDHHYTWDKQLNLVEVLWDDYKVLLNPVMVTGIAYKKDARLAPEEEKEKIEKAYSMFCNDGFWMHAFVKLHDPGTERGLHITEDGDSTLLVTYKSGGVTPGDAYLWFLDESGRPASYKMWVSIIPVGGMEFTWENWDTLYNGALIAQNHKNDMLNVPITNIQSGPDLDAVGKSSDLFLPLLK